MKYITRESENTIKYKIGKLYYTMINGNPRRVEIKGIHFRHLYDTPEESFCDIICEVKNRPLGSRGIIKSPEELFKTLQELEENEKHIQHL